MATPRRYLHDRTVLLLLSTNSFLTILGTILIIIRLISGSGTFTVQYRANLGLKPFQTGSLTDILSFIGFLFFVMIAHTFLSARTYHYRRHSALTVLALCSLLLLLAIIVSNALLVLR